jgi:thiamine-monophosphate kinase
MKQLSDYGEDRLITELLRGFSLGQNVIVGAGDDCAVIGRRADRMWQLLKTDCVIEGVHFEKSAESRKIGWKALARVISDIAAMGGLPQHALVTIAVSPDEEIRRLKAIYAGLKKAAARFGVSVVGGETSRSPEPLFISIALTGTVEKSRCVLRSGGRVGDNVFVTGQLGGSIRGKHLDFIPRVSEARWLTENFRIHAMMDLSDGLGADFPRLARASRCGFEIFENALPLTRNCTPQQAIRDGEDYELLFALSPRDSSRLEKTWSKKFPRLALTRVGKLTRGSQLSTINSQPPRGFDHFTQSR